MKIEWNSTCCSDGLKWAEVQIPSGDWLRIQQPLIGGYFVTRFGCNKMLKEPKKQVSAAELDAELTT